MRTPTRGVWSGVRSEEEGSKRGANARVVGRATLTDVRGRGGGAPSERTGRSRSYGPSG